MPTATVTGSLRTFNGANFNHLDPVLIFTPNKAATGANGQIFSGGEVRVTPDQATSAFTVNLEVTESMVTEDVYYIPSIEWRDPAGNFMKADYPGWRLYVPSGGGQLPDLLQQPLNRSMVIKSPVNPGTRYGSGALWLQIDPDDPDNPKNPANTGDLYELRNA